jgi:DNA modification methylase
MDYGDSGGASRFFPVFRYQAKPAKSEKGATNVHPTVKSIALMDWLITLVTPPNGVVLDPFMGSGTTGVAAAKGGFGFIGIEREDEYLAIAQARIGAAE